METRVVTSEDLRALIARIATLTDVGNPHFIVASVSSTRSRHTAGQAAGQARNELAVQLASRQGA